MDGAARGHPASLLSDGPDAPRRASPRCGETCNGEAATTVGTNGNDKLTETAGNDVIVGLGGNDWLRSNAGNDTLDGPGEVKRENCEASL